MGISYLWDTNTVIYFLQKQFSSTAEIFIDRTLENSIPAISVITEVELLCWKTKEEKDLLILRQFIESIMVYELLPSIKIKTAEIRKSTRIKLRDAIIAATALEYELSLLTRNTKDFKDLEGLKLINPFDMKGV